MLKDNNIYFPTSTNRAEDRIFLINAVYHANKIAVIDEPLYFYIKRKGSITDTEHRRFFHAPLSGCSMIVDFINSVQMDELSYSHIFHKQFYILCGERAHGELEDLASRLFHLFSLCKYKNTFLASCDVEIGKLLQGGDQDALGKHLASGTIKRKPSPLELAFMPSLLRRKGSAPGPGQSRTA